MSKEIELKGVAKVIVMILLGLIFFGITANRARLHFEKVAINALNREAIVAEVGPWLHQRIQKHESGDEFVQRYKTQLDKGRIANYRCTIGLIDVRGFGGRVIVGLDIADTAGTRTRYFTFDWDSDRNAWVCDFYNAGDNVAIHPEESGYGWIGQFFHRARWEGSTVYQDGPSHE